MTCPFRYRHKHWWHWLIPSRRRQLRVMNEMAAWYWEREGNSMLHSGISEALVYGEGYSVAVWSPHNEEVL